jgi:sulfide dehydrogenase [flavocytochrome c] flavoprotein subunit
MGQLTRRQFLRSASGLLAVAGLSGCRTGAGEIVPPSGRRVVVVGGGWGGATAAKYVRMQDPSLEVILIEPNTKFVSCPFSNLVLSGVRTLESMTFDYGRLRGHGVRVIHEMATAIEPATKRVRVGEGWLQYDKVIVSPGVEFQYEQVQGLKEAGDKVLHAWKAGPQTLALASQLQAMADGGVVVMTVPPVAYRCPPGPYERASQIAWYLKTKKPKSKLIVLDANPNVVSKTALLRKAWEAYPKLEYRGSN